MRGGGQGPSPGRSAVERTDCGDQERGEDFEAGWDAGVTVISDDLVAIADRTYEQRGRGAPALQLLAHQHPLAAGRGHVQELVADLQPVDAPPIHQGAALHDVVIRETHRQPSLKEI